MTTTHPPIQSHPDVTAVRALLATAGLPTADLTAAPRADMGLPRRGGPGGRDRAGNYGSVALLRSLAVVPDWQGRSLGTTLLACAEQAARQQGVSALYLLTTTAEAFFTRRSYVRIPRETAPPILHQTAEFAALCPARAVCMSKTLAALDAPPT